MSESMFLPPSLSLSLLFLAMRAEKHLKTGQNMTINRTTFANWAVNLLYHLLDHTHSWSYDHSLETDNICVLRVTNFYFCNFYLLDIFMCLALAFDVFQDYCVNTICILAACFWFRYRISWRSVLRSRS